VEHLSPPNRGHAVSVAGAGRVEPVGQRAEAGSEPGDLVEVKAREPLEAARALRSEREANDAMVVAIAPADDEPGRLRSVDELHGAVMTKQQRGRDIPDGRTMGIAAAADRQQELVLRGSQPRTRRLRFAPVEEATQAGPERQQPFVVGVAEGSRHDSIVTRPNAAPPS
jgi:hypothetical protein